MLSGVRLPRRNPARWFFDSSRSGDSAGRMGDGLTAPGTVFPEGALTMPSAAGPGPGTILNVDDDLAARFALTHVLREAGFQVHEAGTGAEALRLAADRPDLILLDVHLPDANGFDLCRRLKEDPATSAIPVVFLSATVVQGEDRIRGLALGADDYFIKPVEPAVVVAHVRALLRIREAQRRAHAAELEAAEARSRLAAIVESADDAIIGMTLDGVITSWNAGAERLYGWSAAEAVGGPLSILVPSDSPDEMPAILARLQRGERIRPYETVRLRKDGTRVDVFVGIAPVKDAGGGILGAASIARDITERKWVEQVLARDALLLANVRDPIVVTDLHGVVTYWNEGGTRLYGWRAGEMLGRPLMERFPEHEQAAFRAILEQVAGGTDWEAEFEDYRKDGSRVWVDAHASRITDAAGGRVGILWLAHDVSGRKRLEEQYRQSQKMEAIGRLAGGVAHDFNNLLTIISGYGELLLASLPPEDPLRAMVGEMTKAGERAAGLTRHLLAFSRRQLVSPRVLDLGAVVTDLGEMLQRVIGEDIDLCTRLQPNLGRVKADPGQVDQVILNLVVNARDAMPQGGKLTIETRNVVLDETYTRSHADARAGPHVLLAVSDTGHGMTDEVKARLFEPFFTTKGAGKGTGLGLATIYGIVKQSGGHVAVYSESGLGTTFKVYLPRVQEGVSRARSQPGQAVLPWGTETVLVVEDDDAVRSLTCLVLRQGGYTVLEASGPPEAHRLAERHEGPIHLLLTDVVMPGGGGRQLAADLLARHPEMKVLYLSGYTDDAMVRHGILEEEVHFLQKPFSPEALVLKVREVLDSARVDSRQ
jgi:two-component system cell cycle sensor histidine kinase/response regulator CckA